MSYADTICIYQFDDPYNNSKYADVEEEEDDINNRIDDILDEVEELELVMEEEEG